MVRSIVAAKIELDDLSRLFRGRKEFPFLDCVLACLHEQWMAADHARAPDTPVWHDDHFDLHLAGNIHASREFWVSRRIFQLNLALAFISGRRLRVRTCPYHRHRYHRRREPGPTESHRKILLNVGTTTHEERHVRCQRCRRLTFAIVQRKCLPTPWKTPTYAFLSELSRLTSKATSSQ